MKRISIGLFLAGLMAVNAGATLIIDDFTGGGAQQAESTNNGVTVTNNLPVAGVPGGSRTIASTCIGTACLSSNSANAQVIGILGVLSYQLGILVDGRLALTYDNDGAGLGGFDINPLGETLLNLLVVGADGGGDNATVNITLTDTSANSFTRVVAFPVIPPNDFSFNLLLSSFTGVNTHSLNSINVLIDTTTSDSRSADFGITLLQTSGEPSCGGPANPCSTPEPATMATMGMGLLGLGFLGRRIRK